MMRKTTIKDIAQECGVSQATVSYVLNNKNNERISDAMKKKILQVSNLLNYQRNDFARGLATGKNFNISIVESAEPLSCSAIDHQKLTASLLRYFNEQGYTISILNRTIEKNVSHSDGIICYGFSKEQFSNFSNNNMAPILCVDMLYDVYMFHQFNYDYKKIKETADIKFKRKYAFVAPLTNNDELKTKIEEVFKKVIFVNRIDDLSKIKEKNLVIISDFIYEVLKDQNFNILKIKTNIEKETESIYQTFLASVERDNRVKTDIIVETE